MKKSKAKIRTEDGCMEIEGTINWLNIGDVKHKFFIHEYDNRTILTHWKTGMRISVLSNIKLSKHVSLGRPITDRDAAIEAIKQLSNKHGADYINNKIHEASNGFGILNQ